MPDEKFLKELLKSLSTNSKVAYFKEPTTIIKLVDAKPLVKSVKAHRCDGGITLCRKQFGEKDCFGCNNSIFTDVKEHYMYAVHIEQDSQQLKVFRMPITVLRVILSWLIEPDWSDLVKPTSEVLYIKRRGSGIATKYEVIVSKQKVTFDVDLDKCDYSEIQCPSYEQQMKLVGSNKDSSDEENIPF